MLNAFIEHKVVKISKLCLIQYCFPQNALLGLLIVLRSAFTQERFTRLTKHNRNYSRHISKWFQKNKCEVGRLQYLQFYFNYLFLYSSFIQMFGKSANQTCLGNMGKIIRELTRKGIKYIIEYILLLIQN